MNQKTQDHQQMEPTNGERIYRYPGPHSFQDKAVERDSFFGRTDEIRDFINKILSSRLIVLFGKSGLGKTSLLQAGVYPRLREQGLLPIPVRVNQHEGGLTDWVLDSAGEITSEYGIDYTPGDSEGLWEFFKTAVFWQGERLLQPVLVFDQFEEMFTLQAPEARKSIAQQIGELVGGGVPQRIRQAFLAQRLENEKGVGYGEKPPALKLVISLREDYVGALQELFPEVPSILSNRVRLTPLNLHSSIENRATIASC